MPYTATIKTRNGLTVDVDFENEPTGEDIDHASSLAEAQTFGSIKAQTPWERAKLFGSDLLNVPLPILLQGNNATEKWKADTADETSIPPQTVTDALGRVSRENVGAALTPAGLATLPLAGMKNIVGTGVRAGFALLGAKSIAENAPEILSAPTLPEKVQAGARTAVGAAMVLPTVHDIAGGGARTPLPEGATTAENFRAGTRQAYDTAARGYRGGYKAQDIGPLPSEVTPTEPTSSELKQATIEVKDQQGFVVAHTQVNGTDATIDAIARGMDKAHPQGGHTIEVTDTTTKSAAPVTEHPAVTIANEAKAAIDKIVETVVPKDETPPTTVAPKPPVEEQPQVDVSKSSYKQIGEIVRSQKELEQELRKEGWNVSPVRMAGSKNLVDYWDVFYNAKKVSEVDSAEQGWTNIADGKIQKPEGETSYAKFVREETDRRLNPPPIEQITPPTTPILPTRAAALEPAPTTPYENKPAAQSDAVRSVLSGKQTVFHFTTEPFVSFDSAFENSIGTHFGTETQAKYVAKNSGKGRVIAAKITMEHPVVLDTDPIFTDAPSLAAHLKKIGVLDANDLAGLNDYLEAVDKAKSKASFDDDVNLVSSQRAALKRIKTTLQSKGYDGFVYPNFFERNAGAGHEMSFAVFDVSQINQVPISYKPPIPVAPKSAAPKAASEIPPLKMQAYKGAEIIEIPALRSFSDETQADSFLNSLDPNADAFLRKVGERWVVYAEADMTPKLKADTKGRPPERQKLLDDMAAKVKEATAKEGALPKKENTVDDLNIEKVRGGWRATWNKPGFEGVFFDEYKSPKATIGEARIEFDRRLELARQAREKLAAAPRTDKPTAGAQAAGPGKAKEAWEMTRDEYLASRLAGRPQNTIGPSVYGGIFHAHESFVKQAHREGKPVPPEVLADYPDLKAKAGAAAVPTTDVSKSESRLRKVIGAGAHDALVEARKAWAVEHDYRYRGLERLKETVVIGLENGLSLSRAAADKMAQMLIQGEKTVLDKLINLEPIKQSEISFPSVIAKWGYERGERGVYRHPRYVESKPPAGKPAAGSTGVPKVKGILSGDDAESGKIAVPSAQDVIDAINAVRDKARQARDNMKIRGIAVRTRDAADNAAGQVGLQVSTAINMLAHDGVARNGSHALKELMRKGYTQGGTLQTRALALAASGALDQSKFASWAKSNHGKGLDAEYKYALDHWPEMERKRQDYYAITDNQTAWEHANGIEYEEKTGYVPQRWKDVPSRRMGFTRQSVYQNLHEGINNGRVPELNLPSLASHRFTSGELKINQREWVNSLRAEKSPVSGLPLVADMEQAPKSGGGTAPQPPKGYKSVMVNNQQVAVEENFAPLIQGLSDFSKVNPTLSKTFSTVKHSGVAFDSFHLGMISMLQGMAGSKGIGKGWAAVAFSDADLAQGIRMGLISAPEAAWAKANRSKLNTGINNGLNITRITDAFYRDFINSIPGVDQTIGRFTRFLFDRYQRSATAQVYVKFYDQYRAMYPNASVSDIATRAVKDTNTWFANLGRQGVFKSQTWQDAARIAAFAPQWFEGHAIRTPLKVAGQLITAPYDLATTGHMKPVAKAAVYGSLGLLAIAQAINLASRGTPTWDNPEPGKKLSAYLPSFNGKGEGFFFDPLGILLDVPQRLYNAAVGGRDLGKEGVQYLYGKLHPILQGMYETASGKDFFNQPFKTKTERFVTNPLKHVIPIQTQSLTEDRPGTIQHSMMQSIGMKTSFAPSPINMAYHMADEWKRKLDVKDEHQPTEEGRFTQLKRLLSANDIHGAIEEYSRLSREEESLPEEVRPKGSLAKRIVKESILRAFTGNHHWDSMVEDTLSPQQLKIWKAAKDQQEKMVDTFWKVADMVDNARPTSRSSFGLPVGDKWPTR